MVKLIKNKTKNGCLIYCNHCNKYKITYKNIYLIFTKEQFKKYQNYIFQIYLGLEKTKKSPKKLRIATLNSPHSILLNASEFSELYKLLCVRPKCVFFNPNIFSLN